MTELENWTQPNDGDVAESFRENIMGIDKMWLHEDAKMLQAVAKDDKLLIRVHNAPYPDMDFSSGPVKIYDDIDNPEEKLAEIETLELLVERYRVAFENLEDAVEA